MSLRLHPAAEAEIQEVARWYESRNSALTGQFLAAISSAMESIERHPHRYSRVEITKSREIRRMLLDNFPYCIIYEVCGSECIAVAVSHLKRHPRYWRKRLK